MSCCDQPGQLLPIAGQIPQAQEGKGGRHIGTWPFRRVHGSGWDLHPVASSRKRKALLSAKPLISMDVVIEKTDT
jgi:hypothetical protein